MFDKSPAFNNLPLWLPPIFYFHRPAWVYEEVLGWQLLRDLLFGKTDQLLEELEAYGDEPLTPELMRRILRHYPIHPAVRELLMQRSQGHNAVEVALWYRDWEEGIFQEYQNNVWNLNRPDRWGD